MPIHAAFGGGSTESTISPLVMVTLALALILVYTLPPRWVIAPYLLFTYLTPLGQGFNLGGVHLFAHRILILAACARMYLMEGAGRKLAGGFNVLDKLFLIWALVRSSAFMLLYQESGAVVSQFGTLWDSLGGYFLVRSLITDDMDVKRVVKVMGGLAVIMAACMFYEHQVVKNVFGLLIDGSTQVDVRNGSVRARGVFEHEILAGTFGATLMPLFLWLWAFGKSKLLAFAGIVSSLVITFTASSSTGVSALMGGVAALFFWPIRKRMSLVRWAIVAAVGGLAVVMKAPVWFVLARVDFTGGSTGWDRANLVDQCVKHFDNWWLIGTKDTASWGNDTWDLCNQFVAEAETGGLLTLILFIGILYLAFRFIGVARKAAQVRSDAGHPEKEYLLWTLGALLIGHLAGFTGVSYFDQTQVWWFVALAMVCASALPMQAAEGAAEEGAGGRQPLELVRQQPAQPAAQLPGLREPSEVDLAWANQRFGESRRMAAISLKRESQLGPTSL